jgi:myosin heavy subunit
LTRQSAKAKTLSKEIEKLKEEDLKSKTEKNQENIELQKIKTELKSLDNEIKLKQDEMEQKEKEKEGITNSLTKCEDDIKGTDEKIDEKKEEAKKKIEKANNKIEEQINELNNEISLLDTEKDNKESERTRKNEHLRELAEKIGGTARESQLVYPYPIEIDDDTYTKIREEVKEKGEITSNIEELLGPRELKGVIRDIVESSCSSNYLELERGELRPQFKKPGMFVGINNNEVFKKFESDIKKIAIEKLLTLLPKESMFEDSYPITIPEKFDIHIYTILDNLSLDSIAEIKELHEKYSYLTEALGADFRANFIDAWERGEIS